MLGCLFIRALDPTYTGEIARYDVDERRAESVARAWELNLALARIATPGTIERPLITVSGTIDQLAPIDEHARAFRREVVRSGRAALHRLYEVQNGGHLDRLRDPGLQFTELEYVAPHAHRALDLLERWVEHGSPAPAGQRIPRGASIAGDPRAEHRPDDKQRRSHDDSRTYLSQPPRKSTRPRRDHTLYPGARVWIQYCDVSAPVTAGAVNRKRPG